MREGMKNDSGSEVIPTASVISSSPVSLKQAQQVLVDALDCSWLFVDPNISRKVLTWETVRFSAAGGLVNPGRFLEILVSR